MMKTAANMDLVNAIPLTGESITRTTISLTTKVIPVKLKISLA
ncbi:hypothetical protein PQC38_gp034 [Aeromonas phage BUCT695]|nr:hypothetical protein PQC38_gp034 [Aeromonas phage BUCT695]UIW10510.1 hypothetical protein [Aeromonas phage BUCT695]